MTAPDGPREVRGQVRASHTIAFLASPPAPHRAASADRYLPAGRQLAERETPGPGTPGASTHGSPIVEGDDPR